MTLFQKISDEVFRYFIEVTFDYRLPISFVMSLVFPSQFFGTVFHITLHRGDGKTKEGTKGHLLTTKDSFSVLSIDWKNTVLNIPVEQVVSAELKGDDVLLHIKNDSKPQTYFIETYKAEKLKQALTPVPEKQTKPIVFLTATTIVPTLNNTDSKDLYDNAATFANKFYTPFGAKQFPPNFGDMIVCMYRARFPNSFVNNISRNIDLLLASFRREFLLDWCVSLVRACRFKVEPNAFEYFVRIIVNTAADIATNAEPLQTNCTDMLTAIAQMSETGDAAPIITAAEQIRAHIAVAVEQSYKDAPPLNVSFSDLMMKVSLVMFCGTMVQIFQVDVDRLTQKAVEFATAIASKLPWDEPLKNLKKALDAFANELLRFMDAKRYEAEFHFVFVAFTIVEDIRRMKLDFGY